ncbi:MAG: hypothetical protein JSS67_03480 [Bacteroidetes bacterium]|nr:hypothetical protein [Bacteroidota bacterium]
MKTIIFFLALFVIVTNVFSQVPTSSIYSKDYYLKKNKNQKTIGWILLGGGIGMIIIGGVTYKVQFTGSIGGVPLQDNHYNNTLPNILIGTGLGAMAGSIPFFISAHGNKKKAALVAISNQNIFLPQQNILVLKMQPTLTLKIPL